jgi:hypothetical protein
VKNHYKETFKKGQAMTIKNIVYCQKCIDVLTKSGRSALDIYLTVCNFQAANQVAITYGGKFGHGHPAIRWMEQKGFILTVEDGEKDLLIRAKGYTVNSDHKAENHEFCAFPKEHEE